MLLKRVTVPTFRSVLVSFWGTPTALWASPCAFEAGSFIQYIVFEQLQISSCEAGDPRETNGGLNQTARADYAI
jgi:hypothetical protein